MEKDPEYKTALQDNIVTIAKLRARIAALEEELSSVAAPDPAGNTVPLLASEAQPTAPALGPRSMPGDDVQAGPQSAATHTPVSAATADMELSTVQLHLIMSTILTLSREGFRRGCMRFQTTDAEKDKVHDSVRVLSVAWLTIPLGAIVASLVCATAIHLQPHASLQIPGYTVAVVLHGVAAVLELVTEPLYILASLNLHFSVRVAVEAGGTVVKCLMTLALVSVTSLPPALVFAYAQLALVCVTLVGYGIYGFSQLRKVEKLLLAEGSKLLLVAYQSRLDQGVYGLVSNLGSLAVRMLFVPLEEAAFAVFSREAAQQSAVNNARGTPDTANTQRPVGSDPVTPAAAASLVRQFKLLCVLVKVAALLGLVSACFGPAYAYTLLRLVYGTRWAKTSAPAFLAYYSQYILILSVNGATEAFVHGVADCRGLTQSNIMLVVFTGAHVACSSALTAWFGVVGLLLADMLNMVLRILYSLWFISRHFKAVPSFTVWGLLPEQSTLAACAACFAVTTASARGFADVSASAQGSPSSRDFLMNAAPHVAVGVATEHLLLGLVEEETAPTSAARSTSYLGVKGLTLERLTQQVKAATPARNSTDSGAINQFGFAKDARRTFEAAANECKKSGVNFIAPEHILLAMLSLPDGGGRKALESMGLDISILRRAAIRRLKGDQDVEIPVKKPTVSPGSVRVRSSATTRAELDEKSYSAVNWLPCFVTEGREGDVYTGPCVRLRTLGSVGWDQISATVGIRFGKTAIGEGLAAAIVNNVQPDGTPLPAFLAGKRLLQLDVALLVAGAKERGELEKRLTKIIAEVKGCGDIILMIDEIHMLVGAGGGGRGKGEGGGGGGLDVANLMKPALARGEFQVIGATTLSEFRKHIEKDAALERRFQPVLVEEPTPAAALEILEGLRNRYERYHRCAYTDEALDAAVALSHKYIADRFLPDKAIDLMDEAGSRARITAYNCRKQANLKQDPKTQRARAELSGPADLATTALPLVDVAAIEAIVASWTGISVESLGSNEKAQLLGLAERMQAHVIGQPDAVRAVANAISRARCGLKDPSRPIASLLFVGPTGVGKTELTRVLAQQYFGSRDAMIRLDMSEYMERQSVSKLVGAPPGYLGYGEGGKLTEAVRRRPCTIVLFDEIEKAHPDVFGLLLQIMEDGRLTDSMGRVVSFKNTLIILTSNIGSRAIVNAGAGNGLSNILRADRAAKSGSRSGSRMPYRTSENPAPALVPAYASLSRSDVSQPHPFLSARSFPTSFPLGPTPHQQWGRRGRGFEEGRLNGHISAGSLTADWDADEDADEHEMAARRARLEAVVLKEVKAFFRPELLNRFDEQIVFHQLCRKDIQSIAELMLVDTQRRLSDLGYSLQIGESLRDRICQDGYCPEFGARPLRQAIVRYIDDPVAEALLSSPCPPQGSVLSAHLSADGEEVTVTHAPEAVAQPLLQPNGDVLFTCEELAKQHTRRFTSCLGL
ncbi:MAG: hypothetical protein WDW38_002362 [Sanguina aurantia]